MVIRGRMSRPGENLSSIDVIKEYVKEIGFGEWKIRLVIHDGKILGFDELETPLVKFREKKEK